MASEWQTVMTRAQKQAEKEEKKLRETNSNPRSDRQKIGVKDYIEDDSTLKMIRDSRDKKVDKWNDLKDVESKIKILEIKYKRVIKAEKKRQIQSLIDSYQKQMKKLILERSASKMKANVEKEIIIIDDESDDNNEKGEEMSVISGVTQNTLATKLRNEMNNERNDKEERTTTNTTKLESLGKTRKSVNSVGTIPKENKQISKESPSTKSNESKNENDNETLISGVNKRGYSSK